MAREVDNEHVQRLRAVADEQPLAGLAPHMRKLHRKAQQSRREQRTRPEVLDEEGRGWGPKGTRLRRALRRDTTTRPNGGPRK